MPIPVGTTYGTKLRTMRRLAVRRFAPGLIEDEPDNQWDVDDAQAAFDLGLVD